MFAVTVLAPASVSHGVILLAAPILALAAVRLAPKLQSWRRRSPTFCRLALALLLAVVLATAAHAAGEEDDPGFVIADQCPTLTPYDLDYWLRNCILRRIYPF